MATASAHPGSSYYVSPTGTIQDQSNPLAAAALKATGYTGPYDWADAAKVAAEGVGGEDRGRRSVPGLVMSRRSRSRIRAPGLVPRCPARRRARQPRTRSKTSSGSPVSIRRT